jgi:hypothetical protein
MEPQLQPEQRLKHRDHGSQIDGDDASSSPKCYETALGRVQTG